MSTPFEIRRELALPVPPEEVWRAIATREGQAGWFMTVDDDGGAEIVEEPPRRLETRFGTQAIEYVVEAASGATTVLRFVHSGMREDEWGDEWDTMTGGGWDLYLFTLGEYLRHFPGCPAVYTEAVAPAGPDVWRRVLAALGDPAVGAVTDTPVGRGVVDVRTGTFLGIRTGHALVRFHERSPIGMALAVGHHDMTPGADPQALSDTWTAWLAEKAG